MVIYMLLPPGIQTYFTFFKKNNMNLLTKIKIMCRINIY